MKIKLKIISFKFNFHKYLSIKAALRKWWNINKLTKISWIYFIPLLYNGGIKKFSILEDIMDLSNGNETAEPFYDNPAEFDVAAAHM